MGTLQSIVNFLKYKTSKIQCIFLKLQSYKLKKIMLDFLGPIITALRGNSSLREKTLQLS